MNYHDKSDLQAKKQILVKLFVRYPSNQTMGTDQLAEIVTAYLETTRGFPSAIFSNACENLAKRPTPFPPSAGELHAECNRLAADSFSAAHRSQPKRLPRPEYTDEHRERMLSLIEELNNDLATGRIIPPHKCQHGYSADRLADWREIINVPGHPDYIMRTDADGMRLKIPDGEPGAGHLVEHGYLTQYESCQPRYRPAVKRTVRQSHLAKWEKEKGYPYIGGEAVLRMAREKGGYDE